jgi:spermidine/putrescine transport system permease protein
MTERIRPRAPRMAFATLWLVLIFLYLPLGVLICKTAMEPSGLFEVFNDEALMNALQNSLIVAFSSATLATLLGTSAALSLHRRKTWAGRMLNGLSLVSLIFPEIVFALSLLAWFFVLNQLLPFELGLPTVVIAHVTFSLSYVMLSVGSRLATFDVSLEDAARDLGAGEFKVVTTLLVPMLRPAVLGGFILSFLLSFDDFLITYFVNGAGQETLPVKLYGAMKAGVSPKLTALSSLMMVITLTLLVLLFRVTKIQWKDAT